MHFKALCEVWGETTIGFCKLRNQGPPVDEVELAKQVGRVVAARRQVAGLTQAQVADKLGVGQEAMSRLERGAVMPTLVRLARLADILSVPITALLEETSPLAVDVTDEVYRALQTLDESNRIWVKNTLVELCIRLAAAQK